MKFDDDFEDLRPAAIEVFEGLKLPDDKWEDISWMRIAPRGMYPDCISPLLRGSEECDLKNFTPYQTYYTGAKQLVSVYPGSQTQLSDSDLMTSLLLRIPAKAWFKILRDPHGDWGVEISDNNGAKHYGGKSLSEALTAALKDHNK